MIRVNRVTVLPLTAFTRAAERVSADVAFLPPPRFEPLPRRVFPFAKRTSPAGIVQKKKETGIPVQRA